MTITAWPRQLALDEPGVVELSVQGPRPVSWLRLDYLGDGLVGASYFATDWRTVERVRVGVPFRPKRRGVFEVVAEVEDDCGRVAATHLRREVRVQ